MYAENWAFKSWLNNFLIKRGAKTAVQADEHKKYWQWEYKSYYLLVKIF